VAGEKILVVDDEPGVRTALEGILSDEGYRVTSVESAEDGLDAVDRGEFDAILLDVWLPGMDGLEALKKLGERRTDAEVVMISGHGNIETAVRATKLGAFDFVEKPLSLEKTLLVLRNALHRRRLEQRNRQLLEQLTRHSEIIGNSVPALQLREQAAVAAATDAPVLLCGEPGSGRETIARRIHSAGQLADEAFVEVPCGALDSTTAESTLFGAAGVSGRMHMAARGSLFLEDVERLDQALQRKLASHLDVHAKQRWPLRVLASSGPDLEGLDELLRQRLEVIRISVPALRERRDDVPLVAERFMADLAREYGRRPKQLSPDCLMALKTHDWPGNLAELKNLMERLLLFAAADVVQVADLPEHLGGARSAVEDLYRDFATLDEGLRAFERYYVARVLAEENSDTAAAARRLGLTPADLLKRMARPRRGS
jgi:two-component system nitrogen regulation response regulator NtrX